MIAINKKSYIKKSTISNDKSIGWSKLERIEANLQPKAALLKASANDSYYKRILDLNNN